MKGTCKLCKSDGNLRLSHFIPKFIGKWLKETSMTGFFRESSEIDRRKQDLAKEYWLCGSCEALLSVWESEFASKVFYPFVKGESDTSYYTDWMSKFCASLSWRTLTYIQHINPTDNGSPEYIKATSNAENHLASFLLGRENNLYQYEQHILHLGKVESVSEKGSLPPNINRYFLRAVHMDIIGSEGDIIIYTKLPSFMIFGFVSFKKAKTMRASRVSLKTGKLLPTEVRWPDGFIDYIIEKGKEVTLAQRKMSKVQTEKIERFIRENPERARNSKTLEAFLHDYEMFGKDVFKEE